VLALYDCTKARRFQAIRTLHVSPYRNLVEIRGPRPPQRRGRTSSNPLKLMPKGDVFSDPSFFYERAQLAPYEPTHVRPSPGDCAAGWAHKRHARFESSEALAELPAVAHRQPWSCMDAIAAPGCRLQRRSSVSQHVDCVTRAGSPGTESRSRARSLVLLTMLAPVVENRTVRGTGIS
jgi:hypothetical protein